MAAGFEEVRIVHSQKRKVITNIYLELCEHSKDDEHDRKRLGNISLAPGQRPGFWSLDSVFSSKCFAFEGNLHTHLTESFCQHKGTHTGG